MPRIIQKQSDLQEAATHVKYEIDMLVYCAAYVGGWHASPQTLPDEGGKNMALESFLLHYRNLRAFLCPSIQTLTNDDIIASDFLGASIAKDLSDCNKLGVDKRRLDGMLSHLTYRRGTYITGGDQSWNVAGMLVTLFFELENFIAGSLPQAMKPWFPPVAFFAEQRMRFTALSPLPAKSSTMTPP